MGRNRAPRPALETDADIDRWQNVPIPPLLAFGSRVLDRTARLIGRPYRMVVYARKP